MIIEIISFSLLVLGGIGILLRICTISRVPVDPNLRAYLWNLFRYPWLLIIAGYILQIITIFLKK